MCNLIILADNFCNSPINVKLAYYVNPKYKMNIINKNDYYW
jgi:hypothetical protein